MFCSIAVTLLGFRLSTILVPFIRWYCHSLGPVPDLILTPKTVDRFIKAADNSVLNLHNFSVEIADTTTVDHSTLFAYKYLERNNHTVHGGLTCGVRATSPLDSTPRVTIPLLLSRFAMADSPNGPPGAVDEREAKQKKQARKMTKIISKAWSLPGSDPFHDGSYSLSTVGRNLDSGKYCLGKNGWEAFATDMGAIYFGHTAR